MRRVVFVNRYFHPDHSATSQMASDLAFHLAGRGWEVAAITSRQRYDDARANLRSSTERGVRIERIWSTRFGRAGLIGRAFDYATFYLSAFFAIRRERGATIIAMTDPPLLSVVAALASRDVVNWIQDLFPEVAQALGIRVPRVVQRIRDWSLRKARANVVLGELMARRVPKGVVISNWAAVEDRQSCLSGQTGLSVLHQFSVGYSGNLGRAHDVETIAAAIRMLPEVKFVFTGGGANLSAIRKLNWPNVEIRPYVPREQLTESLSSVNVHLVSLLPQLEGLIVPSKFYGVLAVGRPVIFLGARDGELARIIEESRCGLVAETAEQLTDAIRQLKENPEKAEAMGSRGRALYLARYAPEHAFAAWERVLSE